MAINIYTDGACSCNPGIGGWGAVLYLGKETKEMSGAALKTTNNRMELQAVISSLRSLEPDQYVNIFTDSLYIKNGITKWINNWIRYNWKSAKGGVVANRDLWEELHELVKKHNVKWIWVRGHAGNLGNERADYLARSAVKKLY